MLNMSYTCVYSSCVECDGCMRCQEENDRFDYYDEDEEYLEW